MIESARLYLVTPPRPELGELLRAAVAGGVDAVQIREKSLPDRELLAALELAREVTNELGVPLVVNDRADLALLVGADYVHVGQDDLPASRRFAARAACRSLDPLRRRDRRGRGGLPRRRAGVRDSDEARAPRGRPRARPLRGPPCDVPWFAIGGIDTATVDEVVEAGAARIAVVRAINEARLPGARGCGAAPGARPRSSRVGDGMTRGRRGIVAGMVLAVVAAVAVAAGFAGPRDPEGVEIPPAALLPDIDPLAPYGLTARVFSVDGKRRVRLSFASSAENVGRGPLVIRGRRTSLDQEVMGGRAGRSVCPTAAP